MELKSIQKLLGAERASIRSGKSAPSRQVWKCIQRRILFIFGFVASVSVIDAAPIVQPQSLAIPGVDPGEILLAELNCVSCHQAGGDVVSRLSSRRAPTLGKDGTFITPQYLRTFLTDPHAAKPGSTMPDVLNGMSRGDKEEAVDALVHYLVSIQDQRPMAAIGTDEFKMHQGKALYHQVGCVACHAPQQTASSLAEGDTTSTQSPDGKSEDSTLAHLKATSIPLGNLAAKTTVEALAKFLVDPMKTRPSGRMPSLALTDGEATSIAMYLLRDQAPALANPSGSHAKIRGISYQYFEGGFGPVADFEKATPVETGSLDVFSLKPKKRESNFGFRFTGFITVPADGTYTFYTDSDDGSRLYIGTKLVVQNDGNHAMTEKKGTIELKAGDHPVMVAYFNGGGEYGLKVHYEGPGISKQEVPAAILSRIGQPMIPLGTESFTVDVAKAAHGKALFGSLGCAVCHQVGDSALASSKAKSFEALKPETSEGCLAVNVPKGLPQFNLDDAQRKAIRQTLAQRSTLSKPLSTKDRIHTTMVALNCYTCHSRDDLGGPEAGRSEYFVVNGEADLGDEGRIPPHLTKVGDKLKPEWIREVLVNKGYARPYMATRMPQFGEKNVGHLISAFSEADSGSASADTKEVSQRDAKFGRKLVGRDGLSCISCHTFGEFKSLGIPAMDLTMMTKRLKKDWFHRYLIDPASLRPGTRMPSFWPDGQAVNREVFNGDTERQINAIWAYLSNGKEADVPLGLIKAKMELVAEQEAIIYRHFIEGAGSRAIGVGFPEKANLAFDANELRLAMIWQGGFIDASKHRTDRGEGFQPPLGDRVMKMPNGPAFAILAENQAPWPKEAGKKAGFKMRGYRLDEKQRPTFLYSFNNIEIEDGTVAEQGELDPELVRTIVLRSDKPVQQLWFRAAEASKIEEQEGAYVVDGRLAIKLNVSGGPQPIVRRIGERFELIVPVKFQGQEARIVERFIW